MTSQADCMAGAATKHVSSEMCRKWHFVGINAALCYHASQLHLLKVKCDEALEVFQQWVPPAKTGSVIQPNLTCSWQKIGIDTGQCSSLMCIRNSLRNCQRFGVSRNKCDGGIVILNQCKNCDCTWIAPVKSRCSTVHTFLWKQGTSCSKCLLLECWPKRTWSYRSSWVSWHFSLHLCFCLFVRV